MEQSEKPATYGRWWNENEHGPKWYRGLHMARVLAHNHFIRWAQDGKALRDVLEIGCGRAAVYPDIFSSVRYFGVDISRKEIDWSRAHDERAWHKYECVNATVARFPPSSFDIVFAHAVIDHVPSASELLKTCVQASRQWIYLSAYRGWFPDLEEHNYQWDGDVTCYYNDLSPSKIRRTLEELGCVGIDVSPVTVNNGAIEREMAIIARVG